MPYQVRMEYSPAYELIGSFMIYFKRKWTRNLDIGSVWLQQVDDRVDSRFRKQIGEIKDAGSLDYLLLLAWKCPERQETAGFLRWLESLSPGQLYEMIAPYVTGPLTSDLRQFRDRFVHLLTEWDAQYFQEAEKAQAEILIEDYKRKIKLAETMDPRAFIERTTGGLIVQDSEGLELIVLTPSLHYRPMNNYCPFEGIAIIQYPVDPPVADRDAPPLSLMRLTRALSDESRLRILKFLVKHPRSFTEIAQFADLSKGTVHHHMMNLRAAGLVRTHVQGNQPERYSIRMDGFAELQTYMRAYLEADQPLSDGLKGR